MRTNTQIIRNLCFGKEVENKLLSKITNEAAKKELIEAIREYSECFASCYECGCDLESSDDDYLTSHGTCNQCAYMEDEESCDV